MPAPQLARKGLEPSPAHSLVRSADKTKVPVNNDMNNVRPITSNFELDKRSSIALSSHHEEPKNDQNFELKIELPDKKRNSTNDSKLEPLTNPLSTPPAAPVQNDFQPVNKQNPEVLPVRGPKAISNLGLPNEFEPIAPQIKSLVSTEPADADSDGTKVYQASFPQFGERLPAALNPPLPIPTTPKGTIAENNSQDSELRKADDQVVLVADGDALWDLATKVYGDGRFFAAVHAANKSMLDGRPKLLPGMKLLFPSKARLLREFRALVPSDILESPTDVPATYTTQSGDSLFTVAREQLGQASRFAEIQELNETQISKSTLHLDELPVGLKLALPPK